jgi:hypothetical protein
LFSIWEDALVSPRPSATGLLLWVRAVMLSAVALGAGAFAHVQADGLLPGVGVLVVLVVCGALACAPFLRHQGSTSRIVVLLVAGQSLVHVALAASAGHRGDPVARAVAPVARPIVASGDRRGSYFDVAYAQTAGQHSGGLSVPAPLLHAVTDVTAHPLMALAHLLAAVACGWWVAMGEHALWRLIELTSQKWSELAAPVLLRWRTAVRAVMRSASDVRIPALVVVVHEPRPQSMVRSRCVSRRGPPVAA